MVPVDFLRYSIRSISPAGELFRDLRLKITVVHVYKLSPSCFPFFEGKPDELLEEVKARADTSLKPFGNPGIVG